MVNELKENKQQLIQFAYFTFCLISHYVLQTESEAIGCLQLVNITITYLQQTAVPISATSYPF